MSRFESDFWNQFSPHGGFSPEEFTLYSKWTKNEYEKKSSKPKMESMSFLNKKRASDGFYDEILRWSSCSK